jgi:predicted nuclease of predicted toxin-antitoxin system
MKWLLDEMLPPATCRLLASKGHDAISVSDAGLAGADDDRVFARAVQERRVLVTENFADYALILEQRLSRNQPCTPIVFVRKADLPRRGSLASHLANRLLRWARAHEHPYVGPHWA